jgi:hypothetical protein
VRKGEWEVRERKGIREKNRGRMKSTRGEGGGDEGRN